MQKSLKKIFAKVSLIFVNKAVSLFENEMTMF